jgi:hypothetical protein
VLIGRDGRTRFHEWTWNDDGSLRSLVRHEFDVARPAAAAAAG